MLNFVTKHKRAYLVVSVLLFFLVAGGAYFLNDLPDSVVETLIVAQAQNNENTNPFEDDALYVITTGTGAPLPDPARSGPQTVVVAGDQMLVFDAGPGSTRRLETVYPEASDVDALFITHYHSDHIGDMGELMLKRWAGRTTTEPLPIYGPPGIKEVVAGFEAAYQLDTGYRVEHHGEEAMPPSGAGGDAREFDLGEDLMASEVVYESGDVQVIAFNVDHAPIFPAVGYRVNYKDRSVVISGDTVYTESLTVHTMDADLFVSEALHHEYSQMVSDATSGADNNASAVAYDIQDYHITPEQAGIVARDAGVDMLLITHVLPPVPNQLLVNPFLRPARAVYDGEVRMANDGTMVKMPVNSDAFAVEELLNMGTGLPVQGLLSVVALGVFGVIAFVGIPAFVGDKAGFMNKTTYIRAVLIVFGLLILTRIPAFINGTLDAITIVSTIVELGFFIWGILVLRKK